MPRGGIHHQRRPFPLPAQEVHVWRAHLDRHTGRLVELSRTLSDDEWEQAARFRLTEDRNRFMLRRSILRAILSLYLRLAPSELRFAYGLYETPFLDRDSQPGSLSFNVTHSRGIALYAVASRSVVGVDIEFVEPLPGSGRACCPSLHPAGGEGA